MQALPAVWSRENAGDERGLFSARSLLGMALVFLLYLVAAWAGQFVFFAEQSSPAVIWVPAGIALSAVLLGGARMAIPVALAQLVAGLTSFGPVVVSLVACTTIGYAIQPLYLGFVLRRLGFDGSMETVRDALLLIGASVAGTAIFPGAYALAHPLLPARISASSMLANFGQLWAGNLLGVLVVVPLSTSWLREGTFSMRRRRVAELVLALAILSGCVYGIFWSRFASTFGLPLVLALWSALFWIAIRFAPRYMAAAIALSAAVAFLGGIIAHPTNTPLATQLFGDELIILIFGPLFLVSAAAAAERRGSARELALRVTELDALTMKLRAEDQAKNNFIATLAHELRNPLSPIVSTLELLQLQELRSESQELIRDARVQAAAMRRLLDDLLDAARISHNKLMIKKEPVDAREIINRSLAASAGVSQRRRHALLVELPNEPLWVDADPVRLEQIVVNLLNNAVRYTEDGGEICVSSAIEGDRIVISVRDTGIGIKKSDLSVIFEPFHQSGAPHRHDGLGIGLAITKRLVELHGGEIHAESEGVLPCGSRFTIRLPRGTPPRKAARHTRGAECRARRILVVDDNKPAAIGLGKLLEHGGHAVSRAHTGAEALAKMAADEPEVVLLDIGLPDIDGCEVARAARSSGSSATLIALTGYGQEEDKRAARDAGFDFHLTKPVSIAEIDNLLSALPERRAEA